MANNIFQSVPLERPSSSNFDMSSDVKLSLNMGKLIPVNLIECLPGDHIKAKSTVMARLAPMLAPIMHRVDIDFHSFFVPTRILWDNFEQFISSGVPNDDTPAYPYLENIIVKDGDLADYFGLPSSPAGINVDKVSAVPFAAYQKVYTDWFRDENLISDEFVKLIDGNNNVNGAMYGTIRDRAWEHDYFTSCLPWPQKGEAVKLPIGGFAPIVNTPGNPGINLATLDSSDIGDQLTRVRANVPGSSSGRLWTATSGAVLGVNDSTGSGLSADLQEATAVNINALRWAIALQSFLERNARGGTRMIETLLAHYGVRSSDKRLQRSEFLGSSRTPMVISEVLQTSETNESPQGNMSGHGLGVGHSRNVDYYVEEWGYFMTIMSVKPKTAYQQGIPRHFSKFDPLDFGWPTLANLGEQPVYNRELYYSPGDTANDDVFGYLPRYSEYKFQQSRVAGDMKTTLSYWHMGRIFDTRPFLNQSFISSNPTHRIFNVTDPSFDKIYAQILHNVYMRRKLPKYGIPSI